MLAPLPCPAPGAGLHPRLWSGLQLLLRLGGLRLPAGCARRFLLFQASLLGASLRVLVHTCKKKKKKIDCKMCDPRPVKGEVCPACGRDLREVRQPLRAVFCRVPGVSGAEIGGRRALYWAEAGPAWFLLWLV